MSIILSPSVLAADFSILGEQVKEAADAGAQYIHLDVMDGLFVPSISLGIPVISSIRKCTEAVFDVHLMIQNPERYIEAFAEAGADIITFHYETCSDMEKVNTVIDLIHSHNCKAGLSIKPKTPVSVVEPYLNKADMILLMTVEPGFGGQKYIPESTQRIRELRKLINETNPSVDLEIDGGVNKNNFSEVVEAGANVIVAGTAVFKGNISENVSLFLK